MAQPTAVINVVGLNRAVLENDAPRLRARAGAGRVVQLNPVLPAVTCSVQASMLTGRPVRDHGIVGNGWYHRDLSEVRFWHRSAKLIQAEPVWETARRRDPRVTCANLFWWHNTYSTADVAVNVRPIYKADGRKLPDCWAHPEPLRHELQDELGTFPLFRFWGPGANISSSRWIARSAMYMIEAHRPTLTLVYLPHLDYALQKLGPTHAGSAKAVREIDTVVGELLDFLDDQGVRTILLGEYGIEQVNAAVPINQHLRHAGLLHVREEDGLEMLDPGASRAFAVADHQVAHVYVANPARLTEVEVLCRSIPGVEQTLDRSAQAKLGLDHPRSGDLVLVAHRGCWFSYDWWFDSRLAPDFARTVDIHRKPGYDPRELFLDPALGLPKLAVAWRLLKKKVGLRTLMDVVPLDTTLVHGSHGRVTQPPRERPVMLLPRDMADAVNVSEMACPLVRDVMLQAMFG